MKTARLNKSQAGLLLTYWCPVSQALTLYLLLIEHSSRWRDLERPAQTLAGQPPFTVRLLLIPRRRALRGLAGDGRHSVRLGPQRHSTGFILPDEESSDFSRSGPLVGQVKDAHLLRGVLGEVREAQRRQKPSRGPVDYVNSGFRM